MKIAVYTIALNEAHHVEQYVRSAADADVVVVADTGSSDGTVELLRAAGAVVHEISVRPWRFDDARNASLALVPADVDVCLAIDLDEVLQPGWRQRLEAEWGDANRGRFRYVWSHRPDGSDGLVFWSNNEVHARHGFRWAMATHEVLVADRTVERLVDLSFEVHHWPDRGKSRPNDVELLQVAVAELPGDPRAAFYLGREYTFHAMWAEAEVEFRRYLALPRAVWQWERAEVMRLLADCCANLGRRDEALSWWRRATAEASGVREPWVALAQGLHDLGDWPGCYAAARAALAIEADGAQYRTEWGWGARPHDLASVSAWHLGLADEALGHAEEAARLAPDDQRIAANVEMMRRR